jgi:hypothetical protein
VFAPRPPPRAPAGPPPAPGVVVKSVFKGHLPSIFMLTELLHTLLCIVQNISILLNRISELTYRGSQALNLPRLFDIARKSSQRLQKIIQKQHSSKKLWLCRSQMESDVTNLLFKFSTYRKSSV